MKKRSSFLKVYLVPCLAFIMTIFLLTFSVNVNAASSSNTVFPYIVPNWRNANSCISDNAITGCIDRANTFYSNNLHYSGELSYLIFTVDGYSNNLYRLILIPNPYLNQSFSSNFDFSSNSINVYSGNSLPILEMTFNPSNSATNLFYYSNTAVANLLGSSATVSQGDNLLTPRYPFYLYGIDQILDTSDNVIFTNIVPTVIPTGHATAPDSFEDPVYNTGHARPTQVPQLTINNYTWTTAPTPDFSTLENTAKSIYNILSWLGSNLLGEFSNLITNLGNIGNYIGSTIQYYGNLIISNIQNGIQNFYDNMVSLFEPIADAVNKIGVIAATIVALGSDENGVFSIPVLTQTLFLPDHEDVSEIIAANDSLHIASTIDIFVDKVWVSENSIIKTLQNVPPSKKFHIPSCIYHGVQIGNFDIDFSWFEPYKTYSDIVIGSFLAIGWVYWFFVSVSHLLRYGKSYEFENGDGEQQKGIFF